VELTPGADSSHASVAEILRNGGFTVDERESDRLGSVLVAETPYALVIALVATWAELAARIDDAQAMLTRLAAEHPSPRSWDLYVVVSVDGTHEDADVIRERLESDTRYARKLIAAGDMTAERRLRALLPLRGLPQIERMDAFAELRARLIEAGIEPDAVGHAIHSFSTTGQVEVR
jgi:hypothetical protein